MGAGTGLLSCTTVAFALRLGRAVVTFTGFASDAAATFIDRAIAVVVDTIVASFTFGRKLLTNAGAPSAALAGLFTSLAATFSKGIFGSIVAFASCDTFVYLAVAVVVTVVALFVFRSSLAFARPPLTVTTAALLA